MKTRIGNLGLATATRLSNSDGGAPDADLIVWGNTLYGTAYDGGNANTGTVLRINTDGTGFAILHKFTERSGSNYTNSDGGQPNAGLVLSGNTLYGTAGKGGSSGKGTVFAINTDGTRFATLYSFTENSNTSDWVINSDGANPGGLILSGNTLYGTAAYGGNEGSGTVFSLSFMPQLAITPLASNILLTWPTNFAGFTLQSTTNLTSPVWTTNLPAPVVVNGVNTVTNPISGTQQFFRLSQ